LIKRFIEGILIGLIKLYQGAFSPYLGNHCRHVPTCSQYMIEAINEWGPLNGTWLGLKRISRCHPWGTHGYDPVPKKMKEKKINPGT
jgi:putative membrane protein insertion efficiency factor